jgi:putative ABC transport system permease protein
MTRHIFKLIWNRKRVNFLMMTEILVSFFVLTAVVGLAVYMADNWRKPIGFDYENVWNISVDMRQTSDDTFTEQQSDTIRQVLLAVRSFPEIEQVAGTMLPPFSIGAASVSEYNLQGRRIEFGVEEVTDEFKDLLGLRMTEGRWFGPEDTGANYDPVVVNKSMRDDLAFAGAVVGMNIQPDLMPGETEHETRRERRVIGVVEAFREDGELDGMANYVLYRKNLANPTSRRDRPPRNILVKVQPGTTADLEERLIRRLQSVAPEWSFDVGRLEDARASAISIAMAPLMAVGLIAAFLMLMVALGLLGVLWQNVTQRVREIGLRRAKGAPRERVQRQILGEIAVMTSLALGVGLAVAVQLPLLDVIYFVPTRVYVIAFGISVAAIYLMTLLCAWYPSRMATRIEPAEALRYE